MTRRLAALLALCACEAGGVQEQEVPYNVRVVLDDVAGASLRGRWRLVDAPPGASARIEDQDGRATLLPDALGTYDLEYVSSIDASAAEVSRLRLLAVNLPPTVRYEVTGRLVRGGEVVIDASGTSDPNGDAVALAWSLVDPPDTSATLAVDGHTAVLRQDQLGDYQIRITATDALGAATDELATVRVAPAVEEIPCAWSFRFLEYSHALDALVMLDRPIDTDVLCVYRPATGAVTTIDVSRYSSLRLSADGMRAVLMNGRTAEIYSLDPLEKTGEFQVDQPAVNGFLLVGDHFYYSYAGLFRRDLATGEELALGGSGDALHPFGGRYLYATRSSSSEIHRWRIDVDPPVYEGSIDRGLFSVYVFYEDGAAHANGAILSHSPTLADDLQQTGAIRPSGGILAYSPQRRAIAALADPNTTPSMWLYDADTLEDVVELGGTAEYLFFDSTGDRLFAVDRTGYAGVSEIREIAPPWAGL